MIKEAVQSARENRDRFTEKQVKELHVILKSAAREVKDELSVLDELAPLSSGQAHRLAHLTALKENIDEITGNLGGYLSNYAAEQTNGAYLEGIKDGAHFMKQIKIPDYRVLKSGEINSLASSIFAMVDKDAIDFLIRYRIELMGDVAEQLKREIKHRITGGIALGKSTPDIARDIGRVIDNPEKFRRAGRTVFKSAQQRLMLICRTETNRAHNLGRIKFYEYAGVEKVQWWAALDNRTCPECSSLNGEIFKIDKVNPPPKHPRCRCYVSSYLT